MVGVSLGGKLHTGRSRNDQVVTDMKLWLRDAVKQMANLTAALIEALMKRAQK